MIKNQSDQQVKSPLHILHLEDDQNDAELIQAALEAGGITSTITRVQTRDNFVSELDDGGIDLIFSDFALLSFDGVPATEIVRTRWPSIPLIRGNYSFSAGRNW